MPFELPADGPTYTDHIITRSCDLIAHNIWQGMEEVRLGQWLNNFPDPEQRYFAARVLDTLIFRSDSQTKSMLTHLFQRTLPDVAWHYSLPSDLHSAFDRLKARTEPKIRVVPVVPSQHSAMASGPLIARLIRRHLDFNRRWLISQARVRKTKHFVVFVDDFIGTGDQFSNFLTQHNLTYLIREQRCCYVAIAAHSDGIRNLRSSFPELPVSAVDLLEPRNGLFHEESLAFPDGTNTILDAREFYYKMLDAFDIHATDYRDGYGGLALTYAFAHGVPNNSTPLLWWPQSVHWTPLFPR